MDNRERDIAAEITEVFRRIRGRAEPLAVLPRLDSDRAGTVRVGTAHSQVLYDAGRLRTALDMLRTGAPLGSFEDAAEGTVLRALRRAALEYSKSDE